MTRVRGSKTLYFAQWVWPLGLVYVCRECCSPKPVAWRGRKPVAFVEVSNSRCGDGTRVTPAPLPRGRSGKRGRGQQGPPPTPPHPSNSLLLPHFGVEVGARVAHAGRRAGSGVTESGVPMPRAPAGASSPVAFCPISVWGRPEGKVGRRAREGDGLPALLAQFLPSLSKGELRIRPGRVGEGLGGGGGEGDFSPAAAAFQRDSARPRGREQGWRRGKEHSPSGP